MSANPKLPAADRSAALWEAIQSGSARAVAAELYHDVDDVECCPVCGDKNCWKDHDAEGG